MAAGATRQHKFELAEFVGEFLDLEFGPAHSLILGEPAIARYKVDGWQPESLADFGFVFLSRGDGRRLLTLTERCRISPHWTHLISSEWDHPISG